MKASQGQRRNNFPKNQSGAPRAWGENA